MVLFCSISATNSFYQTPWLLLVCHHCWLSLRLSPVLPSGPPDKGLTPTWLLVSDSTLSSSYFLVGDITSLCLNLCLAWQDDKTVLSAIGGVSISMAEWQDQTSPTHTLGIGNLTKFSPVTPSLSPQNPLLTPSSTGTWSEASRVH